MKFKFGLDNIYHIQINVLFH
uniref:Uncharacterized protein n=1 Tax=Rhizophora mucronata TaxID=61149 RepID=A0A2P2P5W7_RHIMU